MGRPTGSRIVRGITCRCRVRVRKSLGELTLCEYRKMFTSFGGLLLYMEGPYKKLTPLKIDYVYLLIRKS